LKPWDKLGVGCITNGGGLVLCFPHGGAIGLLAQSFVHV